MTKRIVGQWTTVIPMVDRKTEDDSGSVDDSNDDGSLKDEDADGSIEGDGSMENDDGLIDDDKKTAKAGSASRST